MRNSSPACDTANPTTVASERNGPHQTDRPTQYHRSNPFDKQRYELPFQFICRIKLLYILCVLRQSRPRLTVPVIE